MDQKRTYKGKSYYKEKATKHLTKRFFRVGKTKRIPTFLLTSISEFVFFMGSKMTKSEAEEFVKKTTSGKVKYRELKQNSKKTAYFTLEINKHDNEQAYIYCSPSYRFRSVIAHELGHFISSEKRSSNNNDYWSKDSNTIVQNYASEFEAWKEAGKITPQDSSFFISRYIGLSSHERGNMKTNKKIRYTRLGYDIFFTLLSSAIAYLTFLGVKNKLSFKKSLMVSAVSFILTSCISRLGVYTLVKNKL